MLYARVKIMRSPMEHTAVEVPVYEVPMLIRLHGEGVADTMGYFERDSDHHNENSEISTPAGEYARLERKYARPGEPINLLERVYGLYETGKFETAYEKALHGKPPKGKETKASLENEDKKDAFKVADVKKMSDKQIKELLRSMGVSFAPDAKRKDLEDLYLGIANEDDSANA